MEVKSIMTKSVISVRRDTPIEDAASLMKQHNIGSIPVCDGDMIVGILTDRDIVLRSVADGRGTSNTTCGEVMTANPVVATASMDASEASRIMSENQIRRLPVVDNGKLVGIVALGDLAVEPKLVDEAGEALNDISQPDQSGM